MSKAEQTATLARLSFQLPAERLDEFEPFYESRLLPILESKGLATSQEAGRPIASGIFARLFEAESPSAVIAVEHALQRDADWIAALRELADTYSADAAADCLPYHLSLYSCPAGPGTTVPAGSGFRQGLWLTFSHRDGLTSGGAFGIHQDRSGDMWFASHGAGLSRFDGTHFTNFTVADGLADDRIHAFIVASDGDFWLGTHDGGASRYDGTLFTTYTTADGLPSNEVYSLFEDEGGSVWLGTHGGGVSCFDGESFPNLKRYNHLERLAPGGFCVGHAPCMTPVKPRDGSRQSLH